MLAISLRSNFFRLKEKHNYHLVDNSQLPLVAATASMLLVLSIVFYLHSPTIRFVHSSDNMVFDTTWFFFTGALFYWFSTVVSESGWGYHTIPVRQGLRFGMVLFIVSEIMFFFAFFWAFFHLSLSPSIAVGGIWPPKGIQSLDIWGLPLVNTILLLSSGLTITLAHRALLRSVNFILMSNFDKNLLTTIFLGVVFLCCQGIEYKYGIIFRWKENVYGSTFFVTTGFHGLHVTIGTIFLLFCFLRSLTTAYPFLNENPDFLAFIKNIKENIKRVFNSVILAREITVLVGSQVIQNVLSKYVLTKNQHLGFEAAAWYWHFVDVVWIFLFITIYWWGS